MKFWRWLFKVPVDEHDWKTEAELAQEIRDMKDEIYMLEKEVCHWKSIALNFRKFHQ